MRVELREMNVVHGPYALDIGVTRIPISTRERRSAGGIHLPPGVLLYTPRRYGQADIGKKTFGEWFSEANGIEVEDGGDVVMRVSPGIVDVGVSGNVLARTLEAFYVRHAPVEIWTSEPMAISDGDRDFVNSRVNLSAYRRPIRFVTKSSMLGIPESAERPNIAELWSDPRAAINDRTPQPSFDD
jgi:hypothetical protein